MMQVNTQAKGRNGDDRVWEAHREAMAFGHWSMALEHIRTMNTFFSAYAVDCAVTVEDVAWRMESTPPARLADMLSAEIRKWNDAVEARFRNPAPAPLSYR